MTEPVGRPSFLDELKRRKVVRVAVVYGAVGFAVLQVIELVAEPLGLPGWTLGLAIVLAAAGFPIALVLAWAFELTPEGVKRTEGPSTSTVSTAGGGPAAALGSPAGAVPSGTPDKGATADSAHASSWLSPRALGAVALFLAVGLGGWWMGRSTAPAAGVGGASIAVLPFSDLSADGANRPFTDGLHDDLLTQLSGIGALRVTSRTSVREYRDTDKAIPVIADELGVAAILEGGVQRSGDRIRINVQLIDGETDEHLWAETYDRDLTVADIFDVQSQIAAAITDALRAELTDAERRELAEEPTDDMEAYEAYLAGLDGDYWFVGDSVALLFERAARIDPGFAEAWAGAARAWSWQFRVVVDDLTAADLRERYRAAAERALERARSLTPGSREMRLAEGYFHYYVGWDFDAAARVFEALLAEYPNDAAMHQAVGLIYRRQGRWQETLASFRKSARLEPRRAVYALDLAVTLTYLRRYDDAAREARLALASDPQETRLAVAWADALAQSGAPLSEVQPPLDRIENDLLAVTRIRLLVGDQGMSELLQALRAAPREAWTPGENQSDMLRHWALAVFAAGAGDATAAQAYADSAIAAFPDASVPDTGPDAPFAARRGPAMALALRASWLALLGREEAAVQDLRRSQALWRLGDDHADDSGLAITRAYAWALLRRADDFFAELEPYARRPGDLSVTYLRRHPILSTFRDDPRNDELIRAIRSAPRVEG